MTGNINPLEFLEAKVKEAANATQDLSDRAAATIQETKEKVQETANVAQDFTALAAAKIQETGEKAIASALV